MSGVIHMYIGSQLTLQPPIEKVDNYLINGCFLMTCHRVGCRFYANIIFVERIVINSMHAYALCQGRRILYNRKFDSLSYNKKNM